MGGAGITLVQFINITEKRKDILGLMVVCVYRNI